MKLDNFTINQLIDYSLNSKGGIKKFPLNEISKYLYHRIEQEKYCSIKEIKCLEAYLDKLNRKLFEKEYAFQLKKIMKRSKILIELSREAIKQKKENNQVLKLEDEIIKNEMNSSIYKILKIIIIEMRKDSPDIKNIIANFIKIREISNINNSDNEYKNLDRICENIKDNKHKFSNVNNKMINKLDNEIDNLQNKIKNMQDKINIINKLKRKELIIEEKFPFINMDSIDYFSEKLDIVTDNIIAIDSLKAVSLDGAFNVLKKDDYYIFNIFIADVPTFLKNNRNISFEAYKRGETFYINQGKSKSLNIEMLSSFLARDNLSLKLNKLRNAINFEFIVQKDGTIIFDSISRKKIILTDKYNFTDVDIFLKKSEEEKLNSKLYFYYDMVRKIINKKDNNYIGSFNTNDIYDLVSFPSLFLNYFIGRNSSFAIYRENGKFVKDCKDKYTQSVTPLRKFVSNINLAFFLNQKGVVLFNKKDLDYVKNNEDEILKHLNEIERLKELSETNPEIVKQYVKFRR